MTAYHKYLWYVIRHKWFVMLECFKWFLIWQGLVHDWHKFLPSEFIAYARHFFGPGKDINAGRNKSGYYKPTDTGDPAFELAWLHHTKFGKHHWQYWVVPESGGDKVMEMPDKYILEMLCDWKGAGRAQHRIAPLDKWFAENESKMVLGPITRGVISKLVYMFN